MEEQVRSKRGTGRNRRGAGAESERIKEVQEKRRRGAGCNRLGAGEGQRRNRGGAEKGLVKSGGGAVDDKGRDRDLLGQYSR